MEKMSHADVGGGGAGIRQATGRESELNLTAKMTMKQ